MRIFAVQKLNTMNRQIPDISQKMLTSVLRNLEKDGIVRREIFMEAPPKVEYRLTERGNSLMPHLDALLAWGIEHFDEIVEDRKSHQTDK